MTSSTINNQPTIGVPHMQIARCVQKIQRNETVSKYRDETEKKKHFEDYQNAPQEQKLKMFHNAIAEGWIN